MNTIFDHQLNSKNYSNYLKKNHNYKRNYKNNNHNVLQSRIVNKKNNHKENINEINEINEINDENDKDMIINLNDI